MKNLIPLFTALGVCLMLLLMAGGAAAADNETATNGTAEEDTITEAQGQAAIGIALAMGIAGIASAVGLALAGTAAAGAAAENKDNWVKYMLLQVLPMTQILYAFVIAIVIAGATGLTGGDAPTDSDVGLAAIGVALIVGLTGISAIPQGIVATRGIAATARNPDVLVPSMMYTVMPETTALFGFVIALVVAQNAF